MTITPTCLSRHKKGTKNTYKSVFTINVHEIVSQCNTGEFACLRSKTAPLLKARPSCLLDVTKS